MKIVTLSEGARLGALVDDSVIDINAAFASYLSHIGTTLSELEIDTLLPSNLERFIAAGDEVLQNARKAIDFASNSAEYSVEHGVYRRPADAAPLLSPWTGKRIACIGINYVDHFARMRGIRLAGKPMDMVEAEHQARSAGLGGFWKVPITVGGHEATVRYPSRTRLFDYEGEVSVVIGKAGKDIPVEDASEYIWGATLLNDWSIRDDKINTVHSQSFQLSKNFDDSTTMGPCIVVGKQNYQAIEMRTEVNGEVRQHFNTGSMVLSFAEIISELSRDFTLVPGDVITGGTAGGTAADSSPLLEDGSRPLDLFLKPGDVVELISPQIGTLRNYVVGQR